MKNPNSAKLAILSLVLPVLALGYYLLPDSRDVRESVYSRAMQPFLSAFYHVKKAEKPAELPDAEIVSPENRKVSLKAITKGRLTLVNFWASWCAPCLQEMPSLAKFQLSHPDILIVPVSLDMQKTLPELAAFFKNENMRDLRWFYDESGALRKNMKLEAYPTTYVVDRRGHVVYILQGPAEWDSKAGSDFAAALMKRY